MKKIGILFGQENTFPEAFVKRVNSKNISGIKAEAVHIDKVMQGEPTEYAVIIDRISQDVPFYRAYLKNAAISGTAVINNPFWWSADEKFFNNALATKIGVAVPNTVILPSHERPEDTNENSFRNLAMPFDWEGIFDYVGFPAYMKPHSGGGWKSVYRVENRDELFARHAETGRLVMMLQEEIQFTEYFRCYYLGGDRVHIMPYEPRNPFHLRYVRDAAPTDPALLKKVKDGVIKLNRALGYDFNTVEFAVRDGVPYAIDFCNPAPDADYHSVGEENFEWIVENAAEMAIERAKNHKDGQMNLTWGTFISGQFGASVQKAKTGTTSKPSERKVAASKKEVAKKASSTKPVASKSAKPASPAKPVKKTPAKKSTPVADKKPATPTAQPKKAAAKKAAPGKSTTAAAKTKTVRTAPKTAKLTAKATTPPKIVKAESQTDKPKAEQKSEKKKTSSQKAKK